MLINKNNTICKLYLMIKNNNKNYVIFHNHEMQH